MTPSTPEVIVSGIHLDLTPSLKTFVTEKAEKLFHHGQHIIRVRFELECDRSLAEGQQFTVKGHVEVRGNDLNVSAEASDCHKAVLLVMDKLDRMLLRKQSRRREVRHAATPVAA